MDENACPAEPQAIDDLSDRLKLLNLGRAACNIESQFNFRNWTTPLKSVENHRMTALLTNNKIESILGRTPFQMEDVDGEKTPPTHIKIVTPFKKTVMVRRCPEESSDFIKRRDELLKCDKQSSEDLRKQVENKLLHHKTSLLDLDEVVAEPALSLRHNEAQLTVKRGDNISFESTSKENFCENIFNGTLSIRTQSEDYFFSITESLEKNIDVRSSTAKENVGNFLNESFPARPLSEDYFHNIEESLDKDLGIQSFFAHSSVKIKPILMSSISDVDLKPELTFGLDQNTINVKKTVQFSKENILIINSPVVTDVDTSDFESLDGSENEKLDVDNADMSFNNSDANLEQMETSKFSVNDIVAQGVDELSDCSSEFQSVCSDIVTNENAAENEIVLNFQQAVETLSPHSLNSSKDDTMESGIDKFISVEPIPNSIKKSRVFTLQEPVCRDGDISRDLNEVVFRQSRKCDHIVDKLTKSESISKFNSSFDNRVSTAALHVRVEETCDMTIMDEKAHFTKSQAIDNLITNFLESKNVLLEVDHDIANSELYVVHEILDDIVNTVAFSHDLEQELDVQSNACLRKYEENLEHDFANGSGFHTETNEEQIFKDDIANQEYSVPDAIESPPPTSFKFNIPHQNSDFQNKIAFEGNDTSIIISNNHDYKFSTQGEISSQIDHAASSCSVKEREYQEESTAPVAAELPSNASDDVNISLRNSVLEDEIAAKDIDLITAVKIPIDLHFPNEADVCVRFSPYECSQPNNDIHIAEMIVQKCEVPDTDELSSIPTQKLLVQDKFSKEDVDNMSIDINSANSRLPNVKEQRNQSPFKSSRATEDFECREKMFLLDEQEVENVAVNYSPDCYPTNEFLEIFKEMSSSDFIRTARAVAENLADCCEESYLTNCLGSAKSIHPSNVEGVPLCEPEMPACSSCSPLPEQLQSDACEEKSSHVSYAESKESLTPYSVPQLLEVCHNLETINEEMNDDRSVEDMNELPVKDCRNAVEIKEGEMEDLESCSRELNIFSDTPMRLLLTPAWKQNQLLQTSFVRCEQSQQLQKTRLVLDVDTSNLLDLSISQLENLPQTAYTSSAQPQFLLSSSTALISLNETVCSRIEEIPNSTDDMSLQNELVERKKCIELVSEENRILKDTLDKLKNELSEKNGEVIKLGEMVKILYRNECTLKQNLLTAEIEFHEKCNQYEKLKDYADKVICSMNQEYEEIIEKYESKLAAVSAPRKIL